MARLKKYVSILIAIALTYNVILQPLLNSAFGLNLAPMRLDQDLLRLLAGVFAL